jgi:hypothetical protein
VAREGLVLTDCAGVQVFVRRAGPEPLGARPEGWPASEELRKVVGVRALRCERLALGPFERGPIHLAFDWHNDAQAPPGCGGEAGRPANVLATAWTDDADVAAHLRGRLGVPAFLTTFETDRSPAGAGEWRAWAWGPEDGRSTLSVLADAVRQEDHDRFRAYWPAGDGVGRLTLDWGMALAVGERPAQGSLPPPMLAGDFASLGGSGIDGFEAAGELDLFRDADCVEAAA